MVIKSTEERKRDRKRNKKEEASTLRKEIKKDNSKFKPGNHTVRKKYNMLIEQQRKSTNYPIELTTTGTPK